MRKGSPGLSIFLQASQIGDGDVCGLSSLSSAPLKAPKASSESSYLNSSLSLLHGGNMTWDFRVLKLNP